MGKVTGFLEYERENHTARSPEERITDWNEFHQKTPTEQLQKQGARCMDCGVPFCHSGMSLSNMTTGCPVNNLIPDWNDLVYQGKWEEALKLLLKTNNFPEFTGRVCPAPCEGSCVLGINNPPVTIKNIEYEIIEKGFENGWIKPLPPQSRSGKSVAIIGSGPAGLACADELNKLGHSVTVFERHDRIGGLLMYGIPNMKLDKSIIDRRVKIMEAEGIKFQVNTEVGVNYASEKMLKDFEAVVLCTGATVPRDLPVDGRTLKGIHFAMDFLHGSTKNLLDKKDANECSISAKGKNVIVIGGGDTGTDCIATSIRQGCENVTQLEIMPQPPTDRANNNPWPEWPKILRTDYGQQEAIAKYGHDPRVFETMTTSFEGNKSGEITAINTVKVKWKSENSRFIPVPIAGTEKKVSADLVLLAMGFTMPENSLLKQLGINTTKQSNIDAAYGKFQTNVEHIFAAGDARRGQSLVVWAINEGRGAAKACHAFLSV